MKLDLRDGRPNGTVLLFGITYENQGQGQNRGMATPKVFTYAMLKAGGLWYVTGSGRVPVAAGWGAVTGWLNRDGRQVEWVKLAGSWEDIWPTAPIQATVGEPIQELS